jgi:hypothetical protein
MFALHCAIRKYGADKFSVTEIARVWPIGLNETEKRCIDIFETFALTGHGYNMTIGGDGASGWKQPPVTDEWRRKQRESHLGKKLSDAHRQKLCQAHEGRTYSKRGPETGAKIRARLLGGKLSVETKRKMSEKRRGVPQGPHSEETKRKLSLARKRWWDKRRVLLSTPAESQRLNCDGPPHPA